MSSGTSMWPGLTDPEHSKWYISRFRNKAEIGEDLAGEARLVDAMVERKSRILDAGCGTGRTGGYLAADRKSTRLNSSHVAISYAVFCLKKKKDKIQHMYPTWLN